MFSRDLLHEFPCEEESSLNIIPIDYFIKMMFDLMKHEKSLGNTYNITHTHNIKVREMVLATCEELDIKNIKFPSLKGANEIPARQYESIGVFLPYVSDSHVFNMEETLSLLDNRDIEDCEVDVWIKPVISYGIEKGLLKRASVKH
jgi:hypothetical protein